MIRGTRQVVIVVDANPTLIPALLAFAGSR